MIRPFRKINMVLGGGGVKGIAYIGMFDAFRRRGYIPGNIAGVSAGALAGSLAAAGYDAAGMWRAMERFDFEKIQIDKLHDKVPVVKRYLDYARINKNRGEADLLRFLNINRNAAKPFSADSYRSGILKGIITYCNEGCLFDGDLLEEWIGRTLAGKGIRTFADLRGGKADAMNPHGYKIRMTGVDCTRVKVVTLPDDLEFYGVNPDNFEVAKAVRISTSVPFAFRPVEIGRNEGGRTRMYSLVDGGVLDSFPDWLHECTAAPTVGFRLNAGEHKLLSLDMPLAILKGLISAVHDIGVPQKNPASNSSKKFYIVGGINTTKVDFLDFNLKNDEKKYLLNAGKQAALKLINKL